MKRFYKAVKKISKGILEGENMKCLKCKKKMKDYGRFYLCEFCHTKVPKLKLKEKENET
jgi:tRNA(Ile2) C34 agmatinyltransferase TiaS